MSRALYRAIAFAGLGAAVSSAVADPFDQKRMFAGMLIAILLVVVVYEVAVVFIEAGIYASLLRMRFWKACGMSFVANSLSVIAGLRVLSGKTELGAFIYVPMALLVAVLVETPVVFLFTFQSWRRSRYFAYRVVLASGIANTVTVVPLAFLLSK